jgi:Rrf2 family protein
MLTKKSRYAVKALIALGRRTDRRPVLITELAERERIPQKFLELILLELKNNGILRSKKGKGGGYFLGKSPEDISLGDIIRSLDGPLAPIPCASEIAYEKCDECSDDRTCGFRAVMKEVRDATAKILDGTSLAGVIKRTATLEQQESQGLTYVI